MSELDVLGMAAIAIMGLPFLLFLVKYRESNKELDMRNNMISNIMSRLENIARYGGVGEQMDYMTPEELQMLRMLVEDINTEFKARRYMEEERAD